MWTRPLPHPLPRSPRLQRLRAGCTRRPALEEGTKVLKERRGDAARPAAFPPFALLLFPGCQVSGGQLLCFFFFWLVLFVFRLVDCLTHFCFVFLAPGSSVIL